MWKLYIELAAGCANTEKSRELLKEATVHCPDNLRWKVWAFAARIDPSASVPLLLQSLSAVPDKQKPLVLVELSKSHEIKSDLNKAKDYLIEACNYNDWKILLEFIYCLLYTSPSPRDS